MKKVLLNRLSKKEVLINLHDKIYIFIYSHGI